MSAASPGVMPEISPGVAAASPRGCFPERRAPEGELPTRGWNLRTFRDASRNRVGTGQRHVRDRRQFALHSEHDDTLRGLGGLVARAPLPLQLT